MEWQIRFNECSNKKKELKQCIKNKIKQTAISKSCGMSSLRKEQCFKIVDEYCLPEIKIKFS